MKRVVVIYKGSDWHKEIPFKHVPTREAFEDWNERALKHGVEMYRSSIDWFDIEKGTFSKAWIFRDGKWMKTEREIKPDLIFDKLRSNHDYRLFDLKMEMGKSAKIFNHPLFRVITDNKLAQYMLFPEYMPKTYFAADAKEYQKILDDLNKEELYVVKPLYGSGGFGISIDKKDKLKKAELEFPVIIQEFIESDGIPGFSNPGELADLRLIYMNNDLVYALSRIAKKGSLFTNFHQGADAVLVPVEKIPVEAKTLAAKLVGRLSVFKTSNYSLDFIFDKHGKPYLIEMNTTPGFDLLKLVGDDSLLEKNLTEFFKALG
jgi:glutathione synthase/RimK-type ligase-like ATP-grasp enzyme